MNVPGDELIESLATSYSRAGMDETMVITRSNKRANIYNQGIRNTVLDREDELCRGDQIMNARSYADQGFSMVLNEEDMTSKLLISKIRELYENKDKYIEAMSESKQRDAISAIMDLIMSVIKH